MIAGEYILKERIEANFGSPAEKLVLDLWCLLKICKKTCLTFVSKSTVDNSSMEEYKLGKMILPFKDCTNIAKRSQFMMQPPRTMKQKLLELPLL